MWKKGENAGYQHFLLFLQCFPKAFRTGSLNILIMFKRVKSLTKHLKGIDQRSDCTHIFGFSRIRVVVLNAHPHWSPLTPIKLKNCYEIFHLVTLVVVVIRTNVFKINFRVKYNFLSDSVDHP